MEAQLHIINMLFKNKRSMIAHKIIREINKFYNLVLTKIEEHLKLIKYMLKLHLT